jgi:hypothetical protein
MLSLLFVLLNKVRQALMALLKAGEGLLQNWRMKESVYSKGWVNFIGSITLSTHLKGIKPNNLVRIQNFYKLTCELRHFYT